MGCSVYAMPPMLSGKPLSPEDREWLELQRKSLPREGQKIAPLKPATKQKQIVE